ncbi:tetratricopeptide repeat protein, partial [Paraburkholderia phymatum]
DLGELEAAAKSYGKALALAPDYAQAYSNLGHVQREQGKLDEAIGSYRQAIALQPDLYLAHQALGLALRMRGELTDARGHLRIALALGTAESHNSYATVLRDCDELDDAISHYREAVSLAPHLTDAYVNLSGTLRLRGLLADARSAAQRAVALDPEMAAAWNSLGNVQHSLDDLPAATRSHRRALELNPADSATHHNLALVLLKQDQPDEALDHAREALKSGEPNASMLVNFGDIVRAQGDIESALSAYREALTLRPAEPLSIWQRLLFCAAGIHTVSPEAFAADARRCAALLQAGTTPYQHARDAGQRARRLRVGFVSGDLRQHPVGIFLESVLEHIDTQHFELFAYSTSKERDDVTSRLTRHFGAWQPLHDLRPEDAARRVYADKIDILVDLAGHTQFSGLPLFAWKPAPVQVSWLGFFATTGSKDIDYFLGDRHVLPEGEESHFVEKPWRL